MQATKKGLGFLNDGREVFLFTLKNKNGFEAKITNYGGIITELLIPDKKGIFEDVVLGFDNLGDYLKEAYFKENPFFGALIGRFGNRIAEGKFTLDGKEYQLAQNNGSHHLHGGDKGFDKVLWDAEELKTEEGPALKLSYLSKDMEEGYPGNLSVEVIYTLTNDNELKIDYKATTDKKTIINLTHHTYFNFNGNAKGDILNHQVSINANKFLPIDETSIPLGSLQDVSGSPFDFTKPKEVGKEINADDKQIRNGRGYDHCWVLNDAPASENLKLAATVFHPQSGRYMEVFTTQPGIQFYTGNFLNGRLVGKQGVAYHQRYGLCLETQHFPDAPNQPGFPSVVLNEGDVYKSTTIYKFKIQ